MGGKHSFIREVKLNNVKGRVNYITDPKRQENLYAVYSNVYKRYWDILSQVNQNAFAKTGQDKAGQSCIEAREFIIMLPPSLIGYDHDELLKYFVEGFAEKYNVGCSAALHHNKRKTNLHIHLIFSERELLPEPEKKIASRNRFYNEEGKHVRTKKEVTGEDGKLRPGCIMIPKGEVYEVNYFKPKDKRFKSSAYLEEMKSYLTDQMNALVKDENEKLSVFSKDGPYLATKKIGKNNPMADVIRKDNELRQAWNQEVDRAFLEGATKEEIMELRKEHVDQAIAASIETNGEQPELLAGILTKAVGHLRGFLQYLHDLKSGLTDVINVKAAEEKIKQKIQEKAYVPRPSSMAQEAKLRSLYQVHNRMVKKNKKIHGMEAELISLKNKWSGLSGVFDRKEKKELKAEIDALEEKIFQEKQQLCEIPREHGFVNAMHLEAELKDARRNLRIVKVRQEEWDKVYGDQIGYLEAPKEDKTGMNPKETKRRSVRAQLEEAKRMSRVQNQKDKISSKKMER